MDENLLVVTDSLVAFRRVLATTVVEEASTDRLSDLCVVLKVETTARNHG